MAFIYISNGLGSTIIEKLDNHFGGSNVFFLSKVSSKAGVICTQRAPLLVATWVVRREGGEEISG